ncbi:DUF397 domain-containing protein [Streptomyces yerevanensis]|uniref:DUF397 domain-containing protein n=1 Tax=Streptomyces yerevanensis TaxID=66378 RepID=UPI000525BD96|nr:DUF397 domain-containing protein [Streptomyces yerevanensis]
MSNTPIAERLAAAAWFKSGYSAADNECVEVTYIEPWVGVRDSKAPSQGALTIGADTFALFISGVRAELGAIAR